MKLFPVSVSISVSNSVSISIPLYITGLSHTLSISLPKVRAIKAQSQGYQISCSKSELLKYHYPNQGSRLSISGLSCAHLKALICPSQDSHMPISRLSFLSINAQFKALIYPTQGSRLPNSGLSVSITGLSFAQLKALIIFVSKNSIKDRSKKIDRRGQIEEDIRKVL
jgi:hypothetical protein